MVNSYGIVGTGQGREITAPNPGLKGRFDQTRDGPESDLAGDESRDRNLVGGVEHRGCAAAGAQRLISQAQARESIEIRGFEGQLANLGKVELGRRSGDSVRPAQAMRD